MSQHAAQRRFEGPPFPSVVQETVRDLTSYWWVLLLAGIVWIVAGLVILQFDDASVTTVGVLVGLFFLFAGALERRAHRDSRPHALGLRPVRRAVFHRGHRLLRQP